MLYYSVVSCLALTTTFAGRYYRQDCRGAKNCRY